MRPLLAELAKRLGIGVADLDPLKRSKLWACLVKSTASIVVLFESPLARPPEVTEVNLNPKPLRGETYWFLGTLVVAVDPNNPENQGNNNLLYAILHELLHAGNMVGCTKNNPDTDPRADGSIKEYIKLILR